MKVRDFFLFIFISKFLPHPLFSVSNRLLFIYSILWFVTLISTKISYEKKIRLVLLSLNNQAWIAKKKKTDFYHTIRITGRSSSNIRLSYGWQNKKKKKRKRDWIKKINLLMILFSRLKLEYIYWTTYFKIIIPGFIYCCIKLWNYFKKI